MCGPMEHKAEHASLAPPTEGKPLARKEDAGPPQVAGVLAKVGDVVAVLLPLYVIGNYFYPLPPLQERALFCLLVLVLVFLRSAARVGRPMVVKALDLLAVVLVVVSFGYPTVHYQDIAAAPTTDPVNLVLGCLAIVLAIEATRRALSTALAVIVMVVILYGLYGNFLPREYGGHGGFDVGRIVTTTYLGTQGMFGIVTYTLFKYIFLFVMFGRLLQELGAMDFISTLSRALLGRLRGGPAAMAVISSALMGSLSGSAIANVMVTGSVSIPLMKRLGFRPHAAGGIEAAASTGGQILPPVMGAAAFLMAVVIGVPYLEVVRAATIPALLYFLAMLISVYVYARRHGIGKERKEDLPAWRSAFHDLSGPIFLLGLGSLVGMLVLRYSPTRAALLSMVVMVAVGMLHRKSRMRPAQAVRVLRETSDSFVPIGVAGPSVGIVVGIFLLSGLATRFAQLIVDFTAGNLLVLAIFTMLISIVLGTGLPTSVAYLILALTAAPALVLLGVPAIAAHMFILFAGIMAMITPPVGLASFAAATIAGASFWRTGVFAFLLGLPAYLIPYAFIYNQALLADGSMAEIAQAVATTALGVTFLSLSLIGRCATTESFVVRVLLFACAALLIAPDLTAGIIGGVVGLAACAVSLLWMRAHPERFVTAETARPDGGAALSVDARRGMGAG